MTQKKSDNILRRFYPKVNTRITAPFLLITIIIAGLGVFIVTRLVVTSIDERLSNQLLSSAQAAKNAMVTLETEQLAALRAMVFTEGVPEAMIEHDYDALNELIAPIVANNLVDTAIVYSSGGEVIYSVGFDIFAARLVADPVQTGFLPEGVVRTLGTEADVLGDKFVDVVPDGDSYQLYISAPVVLEDEISVGVIAIGIRSTRIIRRLREQSLADVTLYNEEGVILATTFVGANRADFALGNARLNSLLTLQTEFSPITEITVGDLPYRTLYTHFDVRSDDIGIMAISLPTNFVIQQISVSRNAIIALFGGLFLTVLGIGFVITRSIVAPITTLVDATRAIREGDLSRRTDIKLPDEFGELSTSFDQMTDRLVERNQEIQGLYNHQLEETIRRDAILSSISDGVLVKGSGDEILLANPAARHLIEAVRSHEEEYRTFYYLQAQPQLLTEPRAVTFLDKHYSVLATPVITQSQDVLGYIVVFRDITEMVQAERLKDEMILQLSHELRTPLSSVRGYVELTQLLNHDALNEQSNDFLFKSVEQLQILERMVNQVIDVSAILANDLHLEIANVNLTNIIDDVADEYIDLIESKKQTIGFSFPEDDVLIEGDARQLQDAVNHVIRNAISYTQAGGWLEITLEETPTHIYFYVVDNGVGIAEDEIDRVFERMYRGRSADAGETDTRGLGLGLYISREIINGHNGTISIQSQVNVGTMVTIKLPRRQG